MAGFWCYAQYKDTKKRGYLISCGILFACATLMKILGLIAVIAFLIAEILDEGSSKTDKLKAALCVVIPFAALYGGFAVWYRASARFDFSRYEELSLPWQLWVCFGSHGIGDHCADDLIYLYNLPFAQRPGSAWQRVLDYYRSYSLPEFFEFYKNKLIAVWGDGHFNSTIYTLWPWKGNWSAALTQPERKGFVLSLFWGRAYDLCLYWSGFASALAQLKNRSESKAFFSSLMIVGFLVYLSFFEAAARRAMPAMLFFMFNMVYLLESIRAKQTVRTKLTSQQ